MCFYPAQGGRKRKFITAQHVLRSASEKARAIWQGTDKHVLCAKVPSETA